VTLVVSRILVLGGGRSSEHEVSLASSASVAVGLRDAGFEVRSVVIGRDGVWRDQAGDEVSLTPGRGIPDIDVVFPVLHGPFGEDGTVQGLLETLDVPYVGAGVLASALCMDKVVFKELMAQAGIPQVDYGAVTVGRWRDEPDAVLHELDALSLPVFVKPARLGSSVGIARVLEPDGLRAALDDAFRYDPMVIIEAGATGVEVECSVLGNADPIASIPGEILLGGGESGWYDYEAKYTPGGMKLVVPARISQTALERVQSLAVEAFLRSGCAGLARADFFVDGETVLVNELNTLPGFTATSVFGALFAASGIEYPELLARLVGLAVERHAFERAHSF
jgi:D-alanine-D-alanine ligase